MCPVCGSDNLEYKGFIICEGYCYQCLDCKNEFISKVDYRWGVK